MMLKTILTMEWSNDAGIFVIRFQLPFIYAGVPNLLRRHALMPAWRCRFLFALWGYTSLVPSYPCSDLTLE